MSDAVRAEAELPAAPEEVWDVVMNPTRLGEWVTTHAGVGEDAPRTLGPGDSFDQDLRLSGKRFSVRWEVTECEHPRCVRWTGKGPAGSAAEVRYTLEPLEAGRTRFGYENRFTLPGGALGRLAGRAVGDRVARRESERSLDNLQELLAREHGS